MSACHDHRNQVRRCTRAATPALPSRPLLRATLAVLSATSRTRALAARHGHALLQAAILVLSAAAIALVALPVAHPLRGWGYAVGLASQPFWLAATWRARQWGMFALAIFYCGAWAQGIVNHLL